MQKKDCVSINKCRLCRSKKLNTVLNLGKTPLANSYSAASESVKLKKYPLKINLCENCGHLQLSHSIKPEKMFSNYLYKTNTSKKNFLHFKNYASELNKKFKKNNAKILDIASNDGTFLSFFNKKKYFRLGIDPAKNLKKISQNKGIKQLDKFFTEKTSEEIKNKFGKFDLVTANHVCAHVQNLDDFFKGVKNILNDNGLFVFEVSYRGSVLQKNTFDTIYHEHLDYHALYPISKFLKKFEFNLLDFKITEAQGGSLRVYVSNNIKGRKIKKIQKQLLKEKYALKLYTKGTYKNFKKKITKCKKKVQNLLKNLIKNKKKIAGYGAAAKTTTFLNYFGLSKNYKIKIVFDDNKLKQNLYIPGTRIKIVNPNYINKIPTDILVIFAWNYSDVIVKKNIKFRNKGGKFLIPFPNPKIV